MDTNYPKISIITPSFNQGKFIEETILSVIGQGYPNLEYIIIDGGSSDETVDIIRKYEHHLTYWVSEKDNGQSEAINKGFLKATGDIVGWLNSDDMYMPNCLGTVARLLDKNDRAIFYGNCLHFKESLDGFVISWGSDVVNISKSAALENVDYIIQPSSFWTKRAWKEVGVLNESLHFAFDWEWFLRAKMLGVTFSNSSKSLALYRIHDSHKSGSGGKKRQEEILGIYKTFSGRYAQLFEMVMSEHFNEADLRVRMIRQFLKALRKPYNKGDIVKFRSGNRYRNYTGNEIDNCFSML